MNSSVYNVRPREIDNRCLLDGALAKSRLRPNLLNGVDYELVHETIWRQLASWCAFFPSSAPQCLPVGDFRITMDVGTAEAQKLFAVRTMTKAQQAFKLKSISLT